jgi:hypothetical protein
VERIEFAGGRDCGRTAGCGRLTFAWGVRNGFMAVTLSG